MRSVQTSKAMYINLPIVYRKAMELLREKTGKSFKQLFLEAIRWLVVHYGIAQDGMAIEQWPDWD